MATLWPYFHETACWYCFHCIIKNHPTTLQRPNTVRFQFLSLHSFAAECQNFRSVIVVAVGVTTKAIVFWLSDLYTWTTRSSLVFFLRFAMREKFVDASAANCRQIHSTAISLTLFFSKSNTIVRFFSA